MNLSLDVPFQGILPLVLHKVVSKKSVDWEDVHESKILDLINFVGSRWVVPRDDLPIDGAYWMLTFDDGNISDYDIVFPLLIEREIKATFFLIAEKIDTPGYLGRAQVKEMHRHGMCIGSHSYSHRNMTSLSEKEAILELDFSKKTIEDFLGESVSSFSYPFGECSSVLHQFALSSGYKFIFTTKHGIFKSPLNIIPRNSINSLMSWPEIFSILNPTAGIRFKWLMEDHFKSAVKLLVGRDNYVNLRNKVFKNNEF